MGRAGERAEVSPRTGPGEMWSSNSVARPLSHAADGRRHGGSPRSARDRPRPLAGYSMGARSGARLGRTGPVPRLRCRPLSVHAAGVTALDRERCRLDLRRPRARRARHPTDPSRRVVHARPAHAQRLGSQTEAGARRRAHARGASQRADLTRKSFRAFCLRVPPEPIARTRCTALPIPTEESR
jgi:hypothetical protein